MSKIHEKSPCCRGTILRFGGRRRQCAVCKRTWSAWKKKRGRKKIRVSGDLAHRFVSDRLLPLRAPRSGHRQTKSEREYRLAKSRTWCAEHCPWLPPPKDGPLIAIADGLIKLINGRWHTWYIILVRSVDGDTAIALPPYDEDGAETVSGWQKAFDNMPIAILPRIVALVCDGRRGLVFEAKWRKWVLQRCQFHLIARIQSRRSKWKFSRHMDEGRHIYSLVKKVLFLSDESVLKPVLDELEEISWSNRSKDLRLTLSGFVNHYREFRAYRSHPELHLPATNNTAEVMIGIIEGVSRKARGFQSLEVLNEWVKVVIKTRGAVKCRERNQQN